MDAAQYMNFINRFIQKYPNAADGYIYRARQYAADGSFASADADMKQAVKVADKKDDAHYQYAQLIYQKELYQSNLPYEGWSMDRALEESQAAYSANPMPVYRQQQAQILYAQQKYAEAFTIYDELTRSELRSADIFFAAAQCKLQQDDKRAALALLDSAVGTFSRPYVKTAAPYLRVRAQLSMDIRRYQQAINDMQDLVALEPNNATIWAEKGSYELRVNLLDQAKESAQECIRLDANNSDGYLITGIVQCIKGDKQLGMENLNKAKEMGNEQAQTFIDKYK
jgi:tetratricopeptide (TPR) repeat protein